MLRLSREPLSFEGFTEARMSGDEARALIDAASPGSDWWYDGRDIFHKPDGTNLDQIVIPLPETWHESQRVPRWRCPSGRGCRQLRSVAGGFTEARMSGDGMFWLRRLTEKHGRKYLIWHTYKTEERRTFWAAEYRGRGDKCWLVGDGEGGIVRGSRRPE